MKKITKITTILLTAFMLTISQNAFAEGNIMPVSSDIIISSNIKINGVTVGENGLRIIDNANLVCTLNATNNSEDNEKIAAVLATYTEAGIMHNVKVFEAEISPEETKSVELIYQFDAGCEHTAKLLIWNSLSDMIPVRADISFSQDSGINAYYYNSDNRMIQIDKANGASLYFNYDNMGNLLSKTTTE